MENVDNDNRRSTTGAGGDSAGIESSGESRSPHRGLSSSARRDREGKLESSGDTLFDSGTESGDGSDSKRDDFERYRDRNNRGRRGRPRSARGSRDRGNSDSSASDAASRGRETGTETSQERDASADLRRPVKTRKSKKVEAQKATLVALLAATATLSFSAVANLTGHNHWALKTEESEAFAEATDNFLNTLSDKLYAIVTKDLETILARITLVFVCFAIFYPRFKLSAERYRQQSAERRPTATYSSNGRERRPEQTRDSALEDDDFSYAEVG